MNKMNSCEMVQCQRLNIIAGKIVCGVNTKHAIKDCPPSKQIIEDSMKALKLLTAVVDQMLPQIGKLSIDIGKLNEGLILARPILKNFIQ